MINKSLLLSILILLSQNIFSQEFGWQADFTNTNQTGFVNIWLSPKINSTLKSDFSDLRIYDSKGTEIPYILQEEKFRNRKTFFKEYKIIEKKHVAGKGYTRIVIHNPEKKIIDNISVIIKNADVKKWLKLNGSDDNKTYYVLNDNYIYSSSPNNDGTSEIKVLQFPNTDYQYLELLVSDYFDKPINVLKVGYYDTQIENGLYSDLKISSVKQNDNKQKKESEILFGFETPQYIDKLNFYTEGSTYYLRKAELYKQSEQWNKKKKENEDYWELVRNFEINSFSNASLHFQRMKAEKLKLVIKNHDNQPLKIKEIKARQLTKFLVTELKKDQTYSIKFGNPELRKPNYDLQYFADSIDKNLPLIKVDKIRKLKKEEVKKNKSFFDSVYIWVALGIVVLGLGFMSIKMMKETAKK